jgi:hypothetical protein
MLQFKKRVEVLKKRNERKKKEKEPLNIEIHLLCVNANIMFACTIIFKESP